MKPDTFLELRFFICHPFVVQFPNIAKLAEQKGLGNSPKAKQSGLDADCAGIA